jgi:hypothetical protein
MNVIDITALLKREMKIKESQDKNITVDMLLDALTAKMLELLQEEEDLTLKLLDIKERLPIVKQQIKKLTFYFEELTK